MKKLKQLLSDTLIYGISSVLARFINYLLVPLHTKVFSTAQYGIISLVYGSIAFLNVIFTFGMESAYLRYAKDREKARDVFKTIQLSLLGGATLLALLIWLLSPALMPLLEIPPDAQKLFFMMIGILWFDTLSLVPFAELRLERKTLQYAGIRTLHVIINIALNIWLILGLHMGIEAVFIANLIASVLVTLFLAIYTRKMWRGSANKTLLKKAMKFGLPYVPAGIGFIANKMIDRFFLANYLDPETAHALYGANVSPLDVTGIYSGVYKLAALMLLLIQMFRMAWQPFFLEHSEDKEAPRLFADTFIYFNITAGALFLAVALFIEKIVRIPVPFLNAYIIAPKYWSALGIVPIILAAYWFHGWYMNFSAGILIEEETKVLPKITLIGAAVTIIANIVLIPFFGMMGAAWATLLSYGVMAIILYKKSTDVFKVPYALLKASGMLIAAGICVLLQPTVTAWVGNEWAAGILLFFIGVTFICLLASKTIKQSLSTAGP